jgi:hypothetical protein
MEREKRKKKKEERERTKKEQGRKEGENNERVWAVFTRKGKELQGGATTFLDQEEIQYLLDCVELDLLPFREKWGWKATFF